MDEEKHTEATGAAEDAAPMRKAAMDARAQGKGAPSEGAPSDPGTSIASSKLGCEISADPTDPLLPIWQMCREHHPNVDLSILRRAYVRAVKQHSSQRRKSGEPYIIHPLAVAQTLADLGMSPTVVAAGLLHDTVEDTITHSTNAARNSATPSRGSWTASPSSRRWTWGSPRRPRRSARWSSP